LGGGWDARHPGGAAPTATQDQARSPH
jgi:hypothetical protein